MPNPLQDRGALEELFKILDRLPFVSTVKKDAQNLRALLYERRAPRVVAFGREGSGRTHIANALLGKDALPAETVGVESCRWIRIDADGSRLDWLEVPLGEGNGAPPTGLVGALDDATPDVALFICTPFEVDDGLDASLDQLARLLPRTSPPGEPAPKLLAVLTQVDALPPEEASAPPYPQGKETTIDLARQTLERRLREKGIEAVATVAVAAPSEARRRYALATLTHHLFESLPEEARLEGARALALAFGPRRELANRIVHSCAALALTVGLAPVPLSDAVVIAPLQVLMVSAVAHLGGRPWDRKAVLEWMASMGVVGGVGMGLRWTARQLLKLIPGAGTLVSGGIAGAGTATMGQSAIAYFLRDDAAGQLPADVPPATHPT